MELFFSLNIVLHIKILKNLKQIPNEIKKKKVIEIKMD